MISTNYKLIKKDYILILLTVFAASVFGLFFFKDQFNFYFDQARDAYEVYSIYHKGDIKIQGPSTDIPGLYHGVGWYYFLVIPYVLGGENPFYSGLFLFLLVFISLGLVWKLSNSIFNDRILSFGVILIAAFSPLLQIGARWLSNPTLSLIFTPILLIIFWSFLENRSIKKAILLGFLFGLMLHANLSYLICIFSIPIILVFLRFRIKFKEILFFLAGFIIPLSTVILSEMKFGAKGTTSFTNQFISGGVQLNPIILINHILNRISDFAGLIFFDVNIWILLFLLIAGFIYIRTKMSVSEKKGALFLIGWLITLLLFFLFNTGVSRSGFVFFPYFIPGILLGLFVVRKIIPNNKFFILILGIILIFQINQNFIFMKSLTNPYTVQKGMILSDLQKAIDYTYQESSGNEFTINSITVPLYINTTWSYLYEFYGKRKYGYLPIWGGKDQTGLLGNLPTGQKTNYRFLIIEPGPGIPEEFVNNSIADEDSVSNLISEQKIGTIIVQKRISK